VWYGEVQHVGCNTGEKWRHDAPKIESHTKTPLGQNAPPVKTPAGQNAHGGKIAHQTVLRDRCTKWFFPVLFQYTNY